MEDDALELKTLKVVCDNNNVDSEHKIEVIPGNGACSDHDRSGAHEVFPLLSNSEVAPDNRVEDNVDGSIGSNGSVNINMRECHRELQRVKRELNEVVFWKFKVWMVILIAAFFILLVIAIALIVCAVGHDDIDEKYDASSFVEDRYFRGNFTLANYNFSSPDQFHLLTNASDRDDLLEHLKQQLTDVYSSSPALARYFSSVTINNFRESEAQFGLNFKMPSEHEQLVRYTLSLEMVRNVLLQRLYDQESETGDSLYIIPASLSMEVG